MTRANPAAQHSRVVLAIDNAPWHKAATITAVLNLAVLGRLRRRAAPAGSLSWG
jgi:hypothetical protein